MDFILLGLATWRLASLLVQEDGPWDMFARLRSKLGVRFNERSEAVGTSFLSDLVLCMWCTSVWVGGAMAFLFVTAGSLATILSLPLALSAVAILLNRMVSHE